MTPLSRLSSLAKLVSALSVRSTSTIAITLFSLQELFFKFLKMKNWRLDFLQIRFGHVSLELFPVMFTICTDIKAKKTKPDIHLSTYSIFKTILKPLIFYVIIQISLVLFNEQKKIHSFWNESSNTLTTTASEKTSTSKCLSTLFSIQLRQFHVHVTLLLTRFCWPNLH